MAGAEALRAAALAAILVLDLAWDDDAAAIGAARLHRGVRDRRYSVAAPRWCPRCGPATIARANARIELARTVALRAVPRSRRAGGWVGAAPAFGFAAALSVVAVVLLSGHLRAGPRPQPAPSVRGDQGGCRLCAAPQLLRPVFITQFIFNTASFLLLAVFVPTPSVISGLSPLASARHWRCTASAWWSARCWRRG